MTPSLPRRLGTYQKERFPLAAYAPLVAAAVFAALSFSVHARHLGVSESPGLPGPAVWVVGGLTLLVFFFGLRVLDEHKDAEVDRRTRPELPVPRGLVSLAELRGAGLAALLLVLVGNVLLAPTLLLVMVPVVVWAALMTREFFVPDWLQARPALYLLSHMLIMPLILAYATALDWVVAGAGPPDGLLAFLLASFLAGVVIEVGRKIRAPEEEREGVGSYTRSWGLRAAPLVWVLALTGSAVAGWWASVHTGSAGVVGAALAIVLVASALPALAFTRRPTPGLASRVELAGGVWTLALYLALGAGPYLARWVEARGMEVMG